MSNVAHKPPEVIVTSEKAKNIYGIAFLKQGRITAKRRLRLPERPKHWEEILHTDTSLDLIGIDKYEFDHLVDADGRINLFLPEDRVACLDWEGLRQGQIFRCARQSSEYRRMPIKGSLDVGFVSTLSEEKSPYSQTVDSLKVLADTKALRIQRIDLPDWNSLEKEVRPNRFDVIHAFVDTKLSPAGPQAFIGEQAVPLRNFVRKVAQQGTKFVVLQEAGQDESGIAALRWGAQSLPADSGASIFLCKGQPSEVLAKATKGLYEGLISGDTLAQCLANFTLEAGSKGVSVVTHPAVERGLDIQEEIEQHHQLLHQIHVDLSKLPDAKRKLRPLSSRVNQGGVKSEPWESIIVPDVAKERPQSAEFVLLSGTAPRELFLKEDNILQHFPVDGARATLMALADAHRSTELALTELTDTIQSATETQEEARARYPAAWFYHVDAVSEVPIPDTHSLCWPPKLGYALEFHFWLDIVKTGIASITEVPTFSEPSTQPFPLDLQISVWSDDFSFSVTEAMITLRSSGATERARFRIDKIQSAPREAQLFVFMRFKGTLIAAFRVKAWITEKEESRPSAQTIEYAYLSSDWFKFEKAPSASALAIFITEMNGILQIFTFSSSGGPWASLGPDQASLYENNERMYRKVQLLAQEAEKAARLGKTLNFAQDAKSLATLGSRLFGDLFYLGSTQATKFAKQYIKNLPDGSRVSISIDQKLQSLYIPWGLLYLDPAPRGALVYPRPSGFLGYRCKLSIRPSGYQDGNLQPAREPGPISMGVVWRTHEDETAKLEKSYGLLVDEKKLAIDKIPVQDYTLPKLATDRYDLIEFFCHGRTQVSGQLEKILAKPMKSNSQLLMSLDDEGSLIEADGGYVPLNSLAETLDTNLPGRPLILLSMCESAQIAIGGLGFVPLLLKRGARAIIGTEGPTLWSLSREMDLQIVTKLLEGETIGDALYEARRALLQTSMLSLIYTLYGDGEARLL